VKYIIYAFIGFVGYHVVTTHQLITILLVGSATFIAGLLVQERRWNIKLDEMFWFKQYSGGVGDFTLEQEVRMLRRRLAGLLANPAMYIRAHRITASLGADEPRKITEELEVIEELSMSERL
jgi:hypothetical protein